MKNKAKRRKKITIRAEIKQRIEKKIEKLTKEVVLKKTKLVKLSYTKKKE